jgi:hypothetical protein
LRGDERLDGEWESGANEEKMGGRRDASEEVANQRESGEEEEE